MPKWKGYPIVYVAAERRYRLRHRLVIEKALGRKLRKNEIVHHKNGDKTDYRLRNLEVMTRAKHNKHHNEGRKIPSVQGSRNVNARLTEQQVIAIRQDVRPYRTIAKDYGVSFGLIGHVKKGRVWGHL